MIEFVKSMQWKEHKLSTKSNHVIARVNIIYLIQQILTKREIERGWGAPLIGTQWET